MKSIGAIIAEYHEEKRVYQSACNDVRDKAVELGMDPEFAKDVTKAISYLEGYRANPQTRGTADTISKALDKLMGVSTANETWAEGYKILAGLEKRLGR